MNKRLVAFFLLVIFCTLPTVAKADIAPPEEPPGSNIAPGSETTQVRMMAETVIIDVLADSSGQAAVSASFTMRNLGDETETLQVRFPLTFWNGANDGSGEYPEITDLRVKVNGEVAAIGRTMTTDPDVPWGTFSAGFPPESNVAIEVKYTATGTREFAGGPPFIVFAYVLETGAGWQGTIGSVDLIVRLPYEADPINVILDPGVTGFGSTTPGSVMDGTEVRWHYDDLEPTPGNNLEIALIDPALWLQVIIERQNVADNPQDGEAWGRLGKLYKNAQQVRKGVRTDPAADELFELGAAAYQQAVTLLPDDALWHAGYGELLVQYHGNRFWFGEDYDSAALQLAFEELHLAYTLEPNNQRIHEVLQEIRWIVPESIMETNGMFTFAFLTATPTPRASFTLPPAGADAAPSTAIPATIQENRVEPTLPPALDDDQGNGPLLPTCGLSLLLLPVALLMTKRSLRRQD